MMDDVSGHSIWRIPHERKVLYPMLPCTLNVLMDHVTVLLPSLECSSPFKRVGNKQHNESCESWRIHPSTWMRCTRSGIGSVADDNGSAARSRDRLIGQFGPNHVIVDDGWMRMDWSGHVHRQTVARRVAQ